MMGQRISKKKVKDIPPEVVVIKNHHICSLSEITFSTSKDGSLTNGILCSCGRTVFIYQENDVRARDLS